MQKQPGAIRTLILTLLTVALASTAAAMTDTDLVSYYSMDTSNASTLFDSKGLNNGTFKNGGSVSDAQSVLGNYSLRFAGGGYVQMDKTWLIGESYSLCGQYYALDGTQGAVIAQGDQTIGAYTYIRLDNDESGSWRVNGTGGSTSTADLSFWTMGDWAQFCMVYNESTDTVFAYTDGALANTGTTTGAAVIPYADWSDVGYFNCWPLGNCLLANLFGYLDEVSIWNRSLTADDVQNLYVKGGDPYVTRVNVTGRNADTGTIITAYTVTAENATGTYSNETTAGVPVILYLADGIYNYTINASDHFTAKGDINTTASRNYTEYLASGWVFTFLIYDEITNLLIDDRTIDLHLISDGAFSAPYNTTTGGINTSVVPADYYTLRYWADNYSDSYYYAYLNTTNATLTLYLLNTSKSTEYTITVVDEDANRVQGAVVKFQRWDTSLSAYKTIDIIVTDNAGLAINNIELRNEYHRFLVEYDNITRLLTTPAVEWGTTRTLQISLSEGALDRYYQILGVEYNLTFNTGTDNFRFEYNDPTNTVGRACLQVYELVNLAEIAVNGSCVNSASGTLLSYVTPTNGTNYRAKAYLYYDSVSYYVDSYDYYYPGTDDMGEAGLFIAFMATIALSLAFFWSPSLGFAITPVPFAIATWLGQIPLAPSWGTGLIVVGIVLAFVFRRSD